MKKQRNKKQEMRYAAHEDGLETNHQTNAAIVEERIRQRAHAIHLEHGGFPGRELDDWLQAEREFKAQNQASNAQS